MTTEAGKPLPADLHSWILVSGPRPEEYVAAIEAEAVAAERARIRAAVLSAGMFVGCGGYGCTEERNDELAAVLALLEETP